MSDNMDEPHDNYPYNFLENLERIMNKDKKYEANKYYVGSNSIFSRGWGHPTETKAIQHAKELLDEQNQDEIFIVKIVKVVKRRVAPVEIVNIK